MTFNIYDKSEVLGAQYTVPLKNLIDSEYDIGLDSYPIWDEAYRYILNYKLVKHYLLYEIAFETPGMFKHYLNEAMELIMPYYNKLYETTLIEYDPSKDFEETETKYRTLESDESTLDTGTTTGSDSSNSLDVTSDTPQNMLEVGNLNSITGATTADMGNSSDQSNTSRNLQSTFSADNTDNYILNRYGTRNNIFKNVKLARDAIIQIDRRIITDREIKSCFMMLYGWG